MKLHKLNVNNMHISSLPQFFFSSLGCRYLSEIDLITQDFQQLVGGVLWLIRDGKSYLEESLKIECSDTEETGERESKNRMP